MNHSSNYNLFIYTYGKYPAFKSFLTAKGWIKNAAAVYENTFSREKTFVV